MSVIIVLIIVSLLVAILFLGAFIWSVKSGQYDDTKSPSIRMLFDEKPKSVGDKTSNKDSEGDKK